MRREGRHATYAPKRTPWKWQFALDLEFAHLCGKRARRSRIDALKQYTRRDETRRGTAEKTTSKYKSTDERDCQRTWTVRSKIFNKQCLRKSRGKSVLIGYDFEDAVFLADCGITNSPIAVIASGNDHVYSLIQNRCKKIGIALNHTTDSFFSSSHQTHLQINRSRNCLQSEEKRVKLNFICVCAWHCSCFTDTSSDT